MQKSLLIEFFNAHEEMLENCEFGITKDDLVARAIDKIVKDTNINKEELTSISRNIEFPEISFVVNDEFVISIYNMDEDGRSTVVPEIYYKEPYTEFMQKFYSVKYNTLLENTPYEVSIYETEDYYESDEDDENSEYDDLPMFEAYIQEKETQIEVDDTTTGRYCSISDVISELESFVDDLLENVDFMKSLNNNKSE